MYFVRFDHEVGVLVFTAAENVAISVRSQGEQKREKQTSDKTKKTKNSLRLIPRVEDCDLGFWW